MILLRNWTGQLVDGWSKPLRINESHPAATRIVAAVVPFGRGWLDLIGGYVSGGAAGGYGYSPAPTRVGMLTGRGASTQENPSQRWRRGLTTTSDVSLLGFFRAEGTIAATARTRLRAGGAGGFSGLGVDEGNGASAVLRGIVRYSGGNTAFGGSFATIPKQGYAGLVTHKSGVRQRLYVEGNLDPLEGAETRSSDYSWNWIDPPTAASNFAGPHIVWDCELPPNLAMELSAEPMALFRPAQAPRVYLLPLASTGTTPVSGDRDLRWDLLAAVAKDCTLPWSLISGVVADRSLQWGVLNALAADRTLFWNALQAVSQDGTAQWSLINAVTHDLDLRHAILNALARDTSLFWNALSAAAKDTTLPWDVLSALSQVYRDADLRWSMLERITKDEALQWALVNAITKDADLRWATLQAVSHDANLLFSILNATAKDSTLAWDLLAALAGVVKDVNVQWSLLAAVVRQLEADWSVLQQIGLMEDLRWGIVEAVLTGLESQWHTLSTTAQDVQARWDLVQAVGPAVTLVWTVTVDNVVLRPLHLWVVPAEGRVLAIEESRVLKVK